MGMALWHAAGTGPPWMRLTNLLETDGGVRYLSGRCRIDAIPVHGPALIDGLRLRLDLRLAPSAQQTKPHLRALQRQVQKLAAVVALGALALGLLVWLLGEPKVPVTTLPPLDAGAPAPVVIASLPPVAPPVTPPMAAVPPLADAAAVALEPATPPPVSRPANSAAAPTPSVAVAPRPPRTLRSASVSAAAVAAPVAAASGAPARRAPERDLSDLFADTK